MKCDAVHAYVNVLIEFPPTFKKGQVAPPITFSQQKNVSNIDRDPSSTCSRAAADHLVDAAKAAQLR